MATGLTQGNNWASTGGSGVQYLDPATGRMVDAASTEGRNLITNLQRQINTGLQTQVNNQQALADAEVNADAQEFEANQNREAGQQAFQLALSQSGGRRAPGGGVARGGYGRRGVSIASATGGLAAANARARRDAQQRLATARVNADPAVQQARQQIASSTPASPAAASNGVRRPVIR